MDIDTERLLSAYYRTFNISERRDSSDEGEQSGANAKPPNPNEHIRESANR